MRLGSGLDGSFFDESIYISSAAIFLNYYFLFFTPSHIYAKGIFNGSPEMRTFFAQKNAKLGKKIHPCFFDLN